MGISNDNKNVNLHNTGPGKLTLSTGKRKELLHRLLKRENYGIPEPTTSRPETNEVTGWPLSYGQEQIWFFYRLKPASTVYTMALQIRLRGPLNKQALAYAFSSVIRRQESLRTQFYEVEGEVRQLITPEPEFHPEYVDLTVLPAMEQEERARGLIKTTLACPFDLAHAPLLRVLVCELGPDTRLLLILMQHIIADGWSNDILIRELNWYYESFLCRQQQPLPSLAMHFKDFAIWQRNRLQGRHREQLLAFWQQYLAGASLVLQLPADYPRPEEQTFRGATYPFALTLALSTALKRLSRQANATVFMTLLAAFNVLLYRYTGCTDILVGSPYANRSRPELESLIGCFVNLLVFRTDLSGSPSFRELLDRVRTSALSVYTHQDMPFELLVKTVHPQRDLSRNPLVQVSFVLENTLGNGQQRFLGADYTVEALVGTEVKFDLTLRMWETAEGCLLGAFEYQTDLFSFATIGRMIDHFLCLLEGLAAVPEEAISRLPLMRNEERQRMLALGQGPARLAQGNGACMHSLFESQVDATPEAAAIVCDGHLLTYRELEHRSNQLAHYLRDLGVGPDIPVALCVRRSPALIVGILGILKAGGAYVPLEPQSPSERLAAILDELESPVLLTSAEVAGGLPAFAGRTVLLDRCGEEVTARSAARPDGIVRPENLAYIIYTSGSTGRPKGVAVPHRQLIHYIRAVGQWANFPDQAHYGLVSTVAADLGHTMIFPSLSGGGCLHILKEEVSSDPEALADYLRQYPLDCLKIVPSHLHALLTSEKLAVNLRLKRLILGGEALSWELAERCRQLGGGGVFNHYGPTETTVGVISYVYNPESLCPQAATVPVGRPLAGVQVYILDEHLEPVPAGVAGELFIAGSSLARGYWRRAAVTAERFVPHPFAVGERMYRTGDKARYLPDGDIEFLGRYDFQVKIRGYRVEPAEIEAVIREYPGVQDTAVIARQMNPENVKLLAYIASGYGDEAAADVRRFLKQKLPEYMLPSYFIFLSSFPVTPNGKLDRRALPEPDYRQPSHDKDFVAPRTREEKQLAGIWAQLLAVDKIGVHDDFFELGGDSLLILKMVSLAARVGLRLSPRNIFNHSTIAGLAHLLQVQPAADGQPDGDDAAEDVPLLPGQDWFFRCNFPDPHWWNVARSYKIARTLAEPVLVEQALAAVISQHAALRARFYREEGRWRQRILPREADHAAVGRVDLSAVAQAEQKQAVADLANRVQQSLHLSDGPLLRLVLIDTGEKDTCYLLCVIHHLAADDVSVSILATDIFTALQQLAAGEKTALPAPTTPVRIWSEQLRAFIRSAGFRKQRDEWLALPWAKTKPLPVDYEANRLERTAGSVGLVWTALSKAETRALLTGLAGLPQYRLFHALLTALVYSTAHWTGERWVACYTVDSGRMLDPAGAVNADLSRTVGWLALGTHFLFEAVPVAQPEEMLAVICEQARCFPRYGIPTQLICQDEAFRQQEPFPPHVNDLMLNYGGQQERLAGENPASLALLREANLPAGDTKNPATREIALLNCGASVWEGQGMFVWRYSKNLYREQTIRLLSEDFLAILKKLASGRRGVKISGV